MSTSGGLGNHGRINGWVLWRHIYGVLARVLYWDSENEVYVDRPHPRTVVDQAGDEHESSGWS